MKRRAVCFFLSVVMLLSMIPTAALQVFAAEELPELKTSEACIQILKEMEGFLEKPVYDNGQYSVGYGSGCKKGEYADGITEEEADALLRKYLASMEKSLAVLENMYSLELTQNQYDALMLFTYNCGTSWISTDSQFRKAVAEGKTGNDFLYIITQWSSASSQLQLHLVKRRLIEADMYLNGSYTNSRPSNYTYVIFDANGGVSEAKVQGYDSKLTASVKPTPARSGYKFLGWYTAEEGGSWVTDLTSSTAGQTLYAHWQEGSGNASTGTAASYKLSASKLASLNTYYSPGGSAAGTVASGSTVKVVADYVDSYNVKWGKLDAGYWVNLGSALTGTTQLQNSTQVSVTVTVTNSYVNVRSGAGTNYAKVGTAYQGDKLALTEVKLVNGDLWGHFSGGWVSLVYTNYESVKNEAASGSSSASAEVIATGTVVNCSTLRVRGNAGLDYAVVGSVARGTRVEITETKEASGMTWGKISSGWISLTYVQLDEKAETPEETEPEPEQPSEEPEEELPEDGPTEDAVIVTVVNGYINVRSGAGAYNAKVGTVYYGDKLVITEVAQVGSDLWGKFSEGWVSLMYTNYSTVLANITVDSSKVIATGTVVNCDSLRIRSEAGTSSWVVGSLARGTWVQITETKEANGMTWGKIASGWISLTYVQLDKTASDDTEDSDQQTPETDTGATEETGEGESGTVVCYGTLNIRSGPGTYYSQIGTYQRGDKVVILEQKLMETTYWGRTSRGWVCMTYITLDKAMLTEGFTGTVNTNGLNIRTGAGVHNASIGKYNKGDKVEVLEITYLNSVAWGRTDRGWICLEYVDR